MREVIAPHDVPYLVGYLVIVMALAAITAFAAGRISKWRFPQIVIVLAGLFIPLGLIGFAAYILIFCPDGPPPDDAKAMAVAGLIFAAIVTYPFTAVSSYIVGRWAMRRSEWPHSTQ
jgi:hypothetical protein